LACRRVEKPQIAKKIMGTVRTQGGRFLKRTKLNDKADSENYGWVEIDDTRVYEKVCQALREGAPQIREQMLKITAHATYEKENSDNRKKRSSKRKG
jgi:hypothetical protein